MGDNTPLQPRSDVSARQMALLQYPLPSTNFNAEHRRRRDRASVLAPRFTSDVAVPPARSVSEYPPTATAVHADKYHLTPGILADAPPSYSTSCQDCHLPRPAALAHLTAPRRRGTKRDEPKRNETTQPPSIWPILPTLPASSSSPPSA